MNQMALDLRVDPRDGEEWRVCPSYPAYIVSSHGRVVGPRGHVLKPDVRDGYERVHIWIADEQKEKAKRVNRMVCEAFHGPAPSPLHLSAHWDGNRRNNRADNLRWATPEENREDMRRHGTYPTRDNSARTKFTTEQIKKFRSTLTGKYGDLKAKAAAAGIPYRTARRFASGSEFAL